MRKVRYFFGLISLFPLLLQAEVQDQDFSELNLDQLIEHIHAIYEARYRNEPFVDVLPLGSHPDTRSVKT